MASRRADLLAVLAAAAARVAAARLGRVGERLVARVVELRGTERVISGRENGGVEKMRPRSRAPRRFALATVRRASSWSDIIDSRRDSDRSLFGVCDIRWKAHEGVDLAAEPARVRRRFGHTTSGRFCTLQACFSEYSRS